MAKPIQYCKVKNNNNNKKLKKIKIKTKRFHIKKKISLTVVKRMMGRKKTQNRHCSSDQGKGMLGLWPMMVATETGLHAQDIFQRSDLQTWLQIGCES